jgi:hypothetical protein
MNNSASKRLQRTIKETRECLADPPVFEQQYGFLNEDLGEGTLQGLNAATVTLGVLATYHGRKGAIRVIDGDMAGWRELHKGIAYHFWSLKISAQVFFKTAFLQPVQTVLSLSNDVSTAASLFCYYLACGNEVRQRYIIDVLKGIATVPGAIYQPFWKKRIFEPFVLRLNQKQENFDLPDDLMQRDLGPYAKVLEHWDTPDQLADAIYDVCDYHCRNMEDTGGDWDPEFDHPPFDLLPCEILAIYAMRQKLGLTTPKVEHPLLATPLVNLTPDPTSGTDDVLSRVENVYSAVFSGND